MKEIYLTILTCSLFAIIAGCKEEAPSANFVLAADVQLSLTNQKGEDLLNPSTQGNIGYSNINHYYLIDGKKVLQNRVNLDLPKMMSIGKSDNTGKYYLRVFLNNDLKDGETSTSILEYDNAPSDTIQASIHRDNYNIYVSDARINGKSITEEERLKGKNLVK